MGMYDSIVLEGVPGADCQLGDIQVKLWDCQMNCYRIGDEVPELDYPRPTYSIALREGGFVNIEENVIKSYSSVPFCHVVVDKWGGKDYADPDYLFRD